MSAFTTAEGSRPEAFGPTEWALLAIPALIWGTSFLLIAIALDDLEPGLIAWGRIVAGAAALAVLPSARRKIAREDWPRIWLLGLFWMALPFTLFPIAQQWIDSSYAGMLNGATPLFAALVASFMLRRAPRPAQAIGLVVGFGGVVAVMWPAIGGDISPLGAGLVLVASASYGLALNLAVPAQHRYGGPPVFLRAQLCAALLTLPYAIVGVDGSEVTASGLAAVVVLGVGATAIAFVAIGALTGRAGATRASIAVYFVPVVAIAVGIAFRDETIAVVSVVGLLIVIAGAGLTSRAEAAAPSDALDAGRAPSARR